jgi:hypothetical protein
LNGDSLVVVRILNHQVDAFIRIENFLLFWNLTVVVHLHSSIDLDSGFSWRRRVGFLLLVVLQSLIESSLFGRHTSFRGSVRRLAPTEVRVCEVHLTSVRRVSWSLVAQVLHLHFSSRWRGLVVAILVWLHLTIVRSSSVLEVLRLPLIHIHIVLRWLLIHTHIVRRWTLVWTSSHLLLRRITLVGSHVLRRLALIHSVIHRWLTWILTRVERWLSLVHTVVRWWSLIRPSVHLVWRLTLSLVHSHVIWRWSLVRSSVILRSTLIRWLIHRRCHLVHIWVTSWRSWRLTLWILIWTGSILSLYLMS